MDSPPPGPRFPSSHPAPFAGSSQRASNSRTFETGGNDIDVASEYTTSASLRRGHSDGDVLGSQLRGVGSSRRTNEETWMDFLRESSRPIDLADVESRRRAMHALRTQYPAQKQERQAVMQRAAIILADRKRRLTENQEDHARRRSASSLPFAPALTAQGTASTSTSRPEPSFAGMEAPLRRADRSTTERPLSRPRPSDVWDSRRRRSREITLPRWQPDSEVTSCPICGTRFGLFFRKHHCRKCGRVVCANCSPHRITIPRQFIVQPSQEVDQGTERRTTADIEVVDLTDDPGTDIQDVPPGPRILDSPQSPILHIDPALGGGQEVRLCNPCVPDPNPLPHLPFESASRVGTHSFPRRAFDRPRMPSDESDHQSASDSPHRSSSLQHSFHHIGGRRFDRGDGSPADEIGTRVSAEQRTRPSVPPRHIDRFPLNYPTAYGSVPHRSRHDVSVLPAFIYHPLYVYVSSQMRELTPTGLF